MRDYNYDYWNDADYDSVDYSAVEQYQERIAELEQVVEDMKTDELYILYNIMKAKEVAKTTLDLVEVYKELMRLIDLHSPELQEKAKLYQEGL
jgi:hypothetical protein